MAKLSADQLAFLKTHKIDVEDMFDGTNMRQKDWRARMREAGKMYAYGVGKCAAGHTLRSRSGHCIQCDTSQMQFGTRKRATARLYILGSLQGRCVKIGLSNDDLDHRIANIRSQGYGSIDDWKLLAVVGPVENAGAIEHAAQLELSAYRIEGGSSNRAGTVQFSKEAFGCGFNLASEALASAVPKGHALEMRCAAAELARYEWKRAA